MNDSISGSLDLKHRHYKTTEMYFKDSPASKEVRLNRIQWPKSLGTAKRDVEKLGFSGGERVFFVFLHERCMQNIEKHILHKCAHFTYKVHTNSIQWDGAECNKTG